MTFEVNTHRVMTASMTERRTAAAIRLDAYRLRSINEALRHYESTAVVSGSLERISRNLEEKSRAMQRYAEAAERAMQVYTKTESAAAGFWVIRAGAAAIQRVDLSVYSAAAASLGTIRV